MATLVFTGNAQAVTQVATATPANVEAGDVFTLTINGKSVDYTATTTVLADVVAGLVSAVNFSVIPEFQEITASDAATHVVLTADTSGKPFTVSGSATDGGGTDTQTLTIATLVQATGPNHWDNADNWSTGNVPAGGDDVFIENTETSILYGLGQSAVALARLAVSAGFTGQIGLPRVNGDGSAEYVEYRPRFLAVEATVIEIGRGSGSGSGRIQIDSGSTATALTVHSTGLPADDNAPAVLWKGTAAGNTLDVLGGSVGVAFAGDETATLATLRAASGDVFCGTGVTLATVACSGDALLQFQSSVTTINQSGGEIVLLGQTSVDTLNLDGGRVDYRSSGTVSSVSLDGPDAELDFSADVRSRTVSSATLKRGSIVDPHQSVTWATGVQPAGSIRVG